MTVGSAQGCDVGGQPKNLGTPEHGTQHACKLRKHDVQAWARADDTGTCDPVGPFFVVPDVHVCETATTYLKLTLVDIPSFSRLLSDVTCF